MDYKSPQPGNGEPLPLTNGDSAYLRENEGLSRHSLYVLLGIGVLGALIISIWVFGGFTPNRQLQLLLSPRGLNFRLFSTMSLLFEGKMVGLIALAFGAGMIMLLSRDEIKGKISLADLFIRRQIWLIILGVLNAVLFLWTEDILFHLGVMGILIFPFFRLSVKKLFLLASLTAVILAGKFYWNYADDLKAHKKHLAVAVVVKKISADSAARAKAAHLTYRSMASRVATDTLTKEQMGDKQAWEGIMASKKYDAKNDEGKDKSMRSHSYGSLYNALLPAAQAREAQWTYRSGIWALASLIFLGMALFRSRFLSGKFSPGFYLLIAAAGLGAGLLLGWYRFYFHIEAVRDYEKYVAAHRIPYNIFNPFETAFMVIGYASLIMALIVSAKTYKLTRPLAAVGKLALSNYFLQTILCTLFFTGFGMGYFGRFSQVELYIVVGEIWIIQLISTLVWLKKFDEGPVEWLWRSLSYGKILPLKRKPRSSTGTPASLVTES